jgi:hypothetical protein
MPPKLIRQILLMAGIIAIMNRMYNWREVVFGVALYLALLLTRITRSA